MEKTKGDAGTGSHRDGHVTPIIQRHSGIYYKVRLSSQLTSNRRGTLGIMYSKLEMVYGGDQRKEDTNKTVTIDTKYNMGNYV